GPLARAEHCRAATGHDRLHAARRRAKRRRALGGLEHAEPAAGAGADEDQPPAGAERGDDQVHGGGDLARDAPDRAHRARVLAIHQRRDAAGVETVEGGAPQDHATIASDRDPVTGLPVISLYGARREPTPAMLAGLDALVVDLQDVGARYYTFQWTLALAMRACARAGVEVVVLDRPNPLGGAVVEGNVPDPAFASFVGLYPLPARPGLTLGELARWLALEHGL